MFRYICLKMFRYIFRKILINYFLFAYILVHTYLFTHLTRISIQQPKGAPSRNGVQCGINI